MFDFHAQLSVAPLKRQHCSESFTHRVTFPRSAERGSIEAFIGSIRIARFAKFQRSAERGSIEATLQLRALQISQAHFHAQLSVAPLKPSNITRASTSGKHFHAQLSVAPLKRRGNEAAGDENGISTLS